MKKIKLVLILIPLFILLIYYLSDKYFINEYNCIDLEEFKNSSYSGIIKNKYIDQENHRIETILVESTKYEKKLIILPADTSGLFQKCNINDSIVKKKGDSFVTLNKEGFLEKFFISWGCE